MQPPPRVRGDRGAALLVALAVNGWAVWALAQAMRPASQPEARAVILQAVWLARHARDRVPPVSTPSRPATAHSTQRRPHSPTPPDTVAPHIRAQGEPPADPMAPRPMSAVYLAQIRHAAADEMAAAIAAPDPLADRTVRLPGRAVHRFRMSEPMSAARAVARVGQLFGGSDPAEPCRSNRAQIAALGTQGDSKRLQQELDFERRLCRP